MSTKKTSEQRLADIIAAIDIAAAALDKPGGVVTPTEAMSNSNKISSWDIRTAGGTKGFNKIRATYFPMTDVDLAELSSASDTAAYITKLEKALGIKYDVENKILESIGNAFDSFKISKVKIPKVKKIKGKTGMTVEALISDIHYGKKCEGVDLEVIRKRVCQFTTEFIRQLDCKKKEGYNVERIVLSLLGDIIESATMHGSESLLGSEFSNSVQVESAANSLFDDLILPIAKTGILMDIKCIPGNHDRSEVNKTFNNPGEQYLSWAIYKFLEKLCAVAGLNNVTFEITKGSFIIHEIYGDVILLEHGDHLSNSEKKSIGGLIAKRNEQIKGKTITMYRGGHWHERASYKRGWGIVNESVCGQDSYAKIKGFSTVPGQTIVFYVNDKTRYNSYLYDYPVHLN